LEKGPAGSRLSLSEHLLVSEIFRPKPGILCDLCQRCRPDFLIVVKAEREVSPAGPLQLPVRADLLF
jgi:hypothetical protein